jgi:Thrombospondin C-terminal region
MSHFWPNTHQVTNSKQQLTMTSSHPAAVALTSWLSEGWFMQAGAPEWNWRVLDNDPRTVIQQRNAFPSLFCSDNLSKKLGGTAIQGAVRVNTDQDNDFFGFAYGYNIGDYNNSDADFLLFDWKQTNQTYSFECGSVSAEPGLAVSRVRGIPVVEEFWGHQDLDCDLFGPGGLEELQRGTNLGSLGWVENNEYIFRFEFGQGEEEDDRLRLYIDDSLEIDLPAQDYATDGAFCFYTFSQSGVRFRGLSIEALTPVTALEAAENYESDDSSELQSGGMRIGRMRGMKNHELSGLGGGMVMATRNRMEMQPKKRRRRYM